MNCQNTAMRTYKIEIKTKTKISPNILDLKKQNKLIFKIIKALRVKVDVRQI